jgi:glycosyltransferase involved in cell wall biosynthesis
MRLLFVIPEYLPHTGGGIITFYRNLLPELARRGHQVHALVGSAFTSHLPPFETEGITVEFLDQDAVTNNLKGFSRYSAVPELQRHLAAAWTAWEQAKRGAGFHLVETTDWGLLFVPWLIESAGPPNVVQLHGSLGQIDFHDPQPGGELQGCVTRLMEAQLLSQADELQTYSKLNAVEWQELTRREVAYIPPAWRSPYPLSRNGSSSRGLVVGRIQYWKGPTILCEAMRLLGEHAPDIDWVGRDTDYHDSGLSMSTYLSRTYPDVWRKKIHPLGPLSPEEVTGLQTNAAFALVSSTWDVFNYTAIEAMGLSCLTVCSEGAGAAELIRNGEDGLTFAANDPGALAEALRRLAQMDGASRNEMGSRARETVEARLAPTRIVQNRIETYEALLRRGRNPIREDAWLSDAVRPHERKSATLAFLDHLPLREISSYALGRGIKKLRR